MADTAIKTQATGRRKEAVASVYIILGKGTMTINNRPAEEYFRGTNYMNRTLDPLKATNNEGRFDIAAKVTGGGISGQAGAVRLGIAKALLKYDENLKQSLKQGGFLTRDPRMKERKKYGQRGARARFQFSKR